MEKRLIRRKKLQPDRTIWLEPEGVTTYSPPPSEHPLYALVGEISMRWSFLEELLDIGISVIADLDQVMTACFTAQMMGHAPRCLTIKAIAHWRGLPDIEKAVVTLQNKMFEVSELRNRAIHDRLLIEQKEQVTFRDHRMSKKELHYGLKEFDRAELERTLSLIDDRRIDCSNLLKLIRSQVYEYYT